MTTKTLALRIVVQSIASVLLMLMVACDDDSSDNVDPYADYGASTYYLTDSDAAWAYAYTDPFEDPYYYDDFGGDEFYLTNEDQTVTDDPELAASHCAENVDSYFSPKGCAKVTQNGAMLTYEFSQCMGPLGLYDINGTMIVTFARGSDPEEDDDAGETSADASGSDTMVVHVTAQNLQANGAVVKLDTTYVYRPQEAGEKQVGVRSKSEASRDGQTVVNDSTSTVTWEKGSQCISLEGAGTLVVDSRTIDVDVSGYKRCARACPTEGTVLLVDDERSTTVTFDGSPSGSVTTNDGMSSTIDLQCTLQ